MQHIRLYTGEDGQSHFAEINIQLSDAKYGKMSEKFNVNGVIFGEVTEEREVAWHNPPCAQYIIMLQGSMEIEIGDGTKKWFHEGDVVLAEDTTGQGHITRAASEGPRQYLVLPLVMR